MAGTSQFTIGTEASCSDGGVGRVSRLIVDPLAEKVTHLVVEPEHSETPAGSSRSTSFDSAAGEIRLRCATADFEKLGPAQETQFIPFNQRLRRLRLRPGPGGLLALLPPGRRDLRAGRHP